jgi:murein DD-endopeptidase MepM/ murein hydrolase activator NlpD
MIKIKLRLTLLSLLLVFTPLALAGQDLTFELHPYQLANEAPCLTSEERSIIQEEIDSNIEKLTREGRIDSRTTQQTLFSWPLRPADHLTDYGYHGVSDFVDHDPTFNQLLDYNCGDRTYDRSQNFYNHEGSDYFLWPFAFNKMDNDDVEIVSMAPGVIITKQDGRDDRGCDWVGTWNAVYVRQHDGSVAWYGHMKESSLTSKAVGDSVERGEYLGIVGSSGKSFSPHLHLEIYDGGRLVDPYEGPCNSMNDSTWWVDQPPYYDPAINKLSSHDKPVGWAECPDPDTTNLSDEFAIGDSVYFYAFGRDLLLGDVFFVTLFGPDQSVFAMDTIPIDTIPPGLNHLTAYYIVAGTVLDSVPTGLWRLSVEYNDIDYEHSFSVTDPLFIETDASDIPHIFQLSQNYPNPFNPSTTIAFELPGEIREIQHVSLTIYDIRGRRVRLLIDQDFGAGDHKIHWDGRNDRGESLPSGVYLYRLKAGGKIYTRKMTILE